MAVIKIGSEIFLVYETKEVEVYFVKDGDEVIAVFPETAIGEKIDVYVKVGQHCIAGIDFVNNVKEATYEEYKDMECELKCIGYNLKIIKTNTV